MEIKDIVQEYAQEVKPVETKQEQVAQPETTTEESSLQDEVTSAPPPEVSNESAYEALLTGKSNIDANKTQQVEETQVPHETAQEPVAVENLEPSTPEAQEDASGMDDVIEEDDFIKAKTGGQFESWEDVVEALNSVNTPKFENEMSEAIYNLLLEGKIDEVADVLGTKMFAEQIKEGNDEDVLKAYIKVNNPEFDDDDVQAEYDEKYSIDEFAFDESRLKREQKKLSQRIRNDVDSAKEFFDSLAQDIKLPELSKQEIAQQDDDSEMEALIQEQRSNFLSSLNNVETRINSLPFSWKDEKSNVAINGKYDIPAQDLSRYRQAAEDLESYQVDRYYKDGKYDADRLVKELYIADNFDRILTSAVSQAVNQTRLEMLKQSKNIQTEQNPAGTFRPNAADEENAMYEQLFMGHLRRQ